MLPFNRFSDTICAAFAAFTLVGAVQIGTLFGMANGDTDTMTDLALPSVSLVVLPNVSENTFSVVETIHWNDTAHYLTKTAKVNTKLSTSVAVINSGTSAVKVRLNGTF